MPRSLSRRTQDALLLSSLAMAVIVGKIYSAAAHSPRLRSEMDFTESANAVSTPLSPDQSESQNQSHGQSHIQSVPPNAAPFVPDAGGEAVGHSLQSPACPPRDVINQHVNQPPDAAGVPAH